MQKRFFLRDDRAPVKMDDIDPEELLKTWLSVDYGRRHYRRWQINERGAAKFSGTQQPCLVHDISPGGASVEFEGSEKMAVNGKIVLQLEGLAPLVAEIRSAFDGQLGLAFLHGEQGEKALAQWLTHEENTRRQHRRKTIACPAKLLVNERAYPCTTQNVSLGGAKIEGEEIAFLQLGAEIALEFDGIGPLQGIIRYKIQHSMGIKFNHTPDSLKTLVDWMK